MRSIIKLCVLSFAVLFLAANASFAEKDSAATTDFGYEGIFNYSKLLFNQNDFQGSAIEAKRLLKDYPASPYGAKARYLFALSSLKAGKYSIAIKGFEKFLSEHGEHKHASLAEEKIKEATALLKEDFSGPKVPEGLKTVKVIAPDRLRAVQVSLFHGKTIDEIDSELKLLKNAGVDTVILRVFHNPGDRYHGIIKGRAESGVYFNTEHAPVIGDVLGSVAKLTKANGLKLFAWMTTKYADYGLENTASSSCVKYDLEKNGYAECRGLDLFSENSLEHLKGLYKDLARYEIDGILFQDDLVLKHTEGYGDSAGKLYFKEMGKRMDPDKMYIRIEGEKYVRYTPEFWEWSSWKNRRLLFVAKSLMETARKENPGIRFALNLMYESVVNPSQALAWLSQDLRGAVKVGFDYYSIMAYHRQMATELNKGHKEVLALIEEMAEEAQRRVGLSASVLMKIQTVDWETGEELSGREVAYLINTLKRRGVSIAVFPYRRLLPFDELALVNESMKETSGGR